MALLSATGTFPPWAGKSAWTVLDTGVGNGQHLLEWYAQWRADPQRPPMLHLVGFGLHAVSWPADHPWRAWLGTSPPGDSHRFYLEDGYVTVTLSASDAAHALREHTFKADAVYLRAHAAPWDAWTFNALARHCKQGSLLRTEMTQEWQHRGVLAAGFCSNEDAGYRYAPAWTPKVRNRFTGDTGWTAGQCAVIGAGIAGASAARALALRGWQVDIYDRAETPAAGASALPVGLVVPHVSQDDNPRSRLSRTGVRLIQAFAQKHLVLGTDWAHTGVMEQRWDTDGLPTTPLWHPEGAWIKPARLVQAWLSHPNIRFIGGTHVSSIRREPHGWTLVGDAGQQRGSAQIVVFANAFGCASLLQNLGDTVGLAPGLDETLDALHCMHGTLSMGAMESNARLDDSAWPAYPCNGDGSFLSGIPTEQGDMWAAGCSFEKQAERLNNIAQQHASNAARLQHLLPDIGQQLAPVFESSGIRHWSGSRCVSHDRFALVGPLDTGPLPTLWVSAAMGSRGLSFAALCAELLVARLGAEPLPVSDRLAKALDVLRPHR